MPPENPKSYPLSKALLPGSVQPIIDELGKTDANRLADILPLFEGEPKATASLAACAKAAFPEKPFDQAVTDFSKFRSRVNAASEVAWESQQQTDQTGLRLPKAPVPVTIEQDTQQRVDPSRRRVWFEGPDPALAAAAQLSASGTSDFNRERIVIEQRSQPYIGFDQRQTEIFVFVSYARHDLELMESLLADLKSELEKYGHYKFRFWTDQALRVGEQWSGEIEEHLKLSHFGLLLLSPDFLQSQFIREHELPIFIGPHADTPCFPVGLERIGLGDQDDPDLRAIIQHHIFLLQEVQPAQELFYEECDANQKKRFAEQLAKRLDQRIGEEVEVKPDPCLVMSHFAEVDSQYQFPDIFEPPRAAKLGFQEMTSLDKMPALKERGVDGLELLEEWILGEDEPPFCAVLGEYGMGKTTLLQRFTQRLLEMRAKDSSIPLPIFLNLRHLVYDFDKNPVPTRDEILNLLIRRVGEMGQSQHQLQPEDIVRLVREEGALMIVDGLDEKTVHLTPEQAGDFIQELWKVLPPPVKGEPQKGRLILSCRSHYFPDVISQQTLLTGNDRVGISPRDYRACVMLPFTEEQVRNYFVQLFGEEEAERILKLLGEIHNLMELVPRPYLLSLVAGDIEWLENQKVQGKRVRGVTLYGRFVDRWLKRDTGKHKFTTTDKKRLMEDLAAALWRSGSQSWKWEKLEHWLRDYLLTETAFASRYVGVNRDLLDEDIRTATFVLRPDESRECFQFAHTSLQEYFLARYLVRALDDGEFERWSFPADPSPETLEFAAQLLDISESGKGLAGLEDLLGTHRKQATFLGFRVWMDGLQQGYRVPHPPKVELPGENLRKLRIKGISLRGANLEGAMMNQVRLEEVDLSGANLSGASLVGAEFFRVIANGVVAEGTHFEGSFWKGCQFDRFPERAIWKDVKWSGTGLPNSGHSHLSDLARAGNQLALGRLALNTGRLGSVHTIVFSSDGRSFVSGGNDGKLRLWGAESGQLRLELDHGGRVNAAAFSPDGRSLLSGGEDGRLRLWDAESGRMRLELEHGGTVRVAVFSPDGRSLLSGGDDGRLRLWDAESGRMHLELGHGSGRVWAAAFSPDGRSLLSGCGEGGLRLWDTTSGRMRLELEHGRTVYAAAFSPDGRSLLSGSDEGGLLGFMREGDNGKLRLWGAESGQLRLELDHGGRVWAAAFSPDGRSLLSGGEDGKLRLWDANSGQMRLELEYGSGR